MSKSQIRVDKRGDGKVVCSDGAFVSTPRFVPGRMGAWGESHVPHVALVSDWLDSEQGEYIMSWPGFLLP